MIKNTSGQRIGAQMVSAADGTAFTGSVTVSVTGDAGTQATGSVGSGACTHEGNGYHTYAPAQAETNYDLIAFTFVGSGAIPVTVQVFPVAGDPFTRLGAPAGASVSADIAAMKVDTAAILVDTGTTLDGRIPAVLVSGRMDVYVGAMAANVMTAAAAASDLTTELQSGLATAAAVSALDTKLGTPAGASVSADLADVEGKVDDLESRLGTPSNLGSGATLAANLVDIEAQTDDIGTAGAGLTALATQASVDDVESKVDDLEGRLTSTRAGYLDNLSAGAVATAAALTVVSGKIDTIDDLLDTEVAAIAAAIAALNNLSAAQVRTQVDDALDASVADSVPADGSRPSVRQGIYMNTQFLLERSVSGTTCTVRKPDGSTALFTLTLSDATSPTSITRAS